MKKFFLRGLIGLLIGMLLLIVSVEILSFNHRYIKGSIQSKVAIENYGITDDTLDTIVDQLINYLKGNEQDLEFTITKDGETVEAFGSREIKHMEDVQTIYRLINRLKWGLLIVLILLTVFQLSLVVKSIPYSIGLSLLVTTLLGASIGLAFQKAFVIFHELSFSNDLWLLNPKTDLLIQLLPLNFFKEIAIYIMGVFIVLNIVLLGIYAFMQRNFILD